MTVEKAWAYGDSAVRARSRRPHPPRRGRRGKDLRRGLPPSRPRHRVHGHAHHSSFEGSIVGVPVHNLAVHVTGKDFWVFDLDAAEPREPVVVEQA